MEQEQLNTQYSTENQHKSNYSDEELMEKAKQNRLKGKKEIYPIEGTPFVIIPKEERWTLVLGNRLLTMKDWETPEEATEYIKTWEFMCELIMTMFYIGKQYEQDTAEIIKEENLQPEKHEFINHRHDDNPPTGS